MNSLQRPSFLRRQLPLAIILVLGIAISFSLFQMKEEAVRERRRNIFPEIAHQHSLRFEWEIQKQLEAAEALRDFIFATPDLNKIAFADFSRPTLERAWALPALFWMPLIPADQRNAFETAPDGFPIFTFDKNGQPATAPPQNNFHLPVRFIEPAEKYHSLNGFDFLSTPDGSALVQLALNSGEITASGPIHWPINASEDETGILLLLPVPQKNDPAATSPRGFAMALFDIGTIAARSFGRQPSFSLSVFDVTDRDQPVTILSAESGQNRLSPAAVPVEFLHTIGGRNWLIRVTDENSARISASNLESWSLLAGGLLFTGFLAIWVRQRQNYIKAVETRVQNRTAALSKINEDLQKEMIYRRQAEQNLQQSEARFREAFWHAPTGFGLVAPDGRWIQVNRALMQITGFSEDELLNKSVADLLHPDDASHELAQIGEKIAAKQRTFDTGIRFRHKNGEFSDLLVNVAQVRDSGDQLLYFILQTLDVTEQKRALEETKAAKEFSESIIRSSSDGIFTFDLEKRITVWNAGMEEMTGIPAKEADGKPLEEVLPFFSDPEGSLSLRRILDGGTVRAAERPYEMPLSRRRGYFAGNYGPLYGGNGKIIGGVAVVRDVTEQREVRERLRAFADLLKQRNRELQEFAYVASHDLQEPLRKVLAFGDRLEKRSADLLDEQALDYLNRMRNASSRMQTLINDLLSFSRISTEAKPFEQVDLNIIAKEVLCDLENLIDETDANVTVEHLPTIEADATQMRQLLQNLISNGLKYRKPETAPNIRVFATLHAAEEDLPPLRGTASLLKVADDGIGFEEKYRDRIFTVFQRLHGRHEYPGTGVGLAICRKIAERHNGWITARSIPGEGSTFIVGLPHKQFADP